MHIEGGKSVYNRAERRKNETFARKKVRRPGIGYGKHALNGNKFRHVHVNWYERIAKEMSMSALVVQKYRLHTQTK
jgi:hypothetical protein